MGNSCGTQPYAESMVQDYKDNITWYSDAGMYEPIVDWNVTCSQGPTDYESPMICSTIAAPQNQNCACTNAMASGYYMVDPGAPQKGIQCLPSDQGYLTSLEFDQAQYAFHLATMGRISDLCTPQLADTVWPHFYHMYDTTNGCCQVEAYISKNAEVIPPACAAALRQNNTDEIQKLYGVLNGYDFNLYNGTGGASPLNWTGGIGDQTYWTFDQLKANFGRQTIQNTVWGFNYGDPTWNHAQRQKMYREVIGDSYIDGGNGQAFIDQWAQAYVDQGIVSGGRSADDYFDPSVHAGAYNWSTDPKYEGYLPYAPPWSVGGDIWHRSTVDKNDHEYVDACYQPDVIAEIVPYVGAIIAGGFAGVIVPGQMARVLGAGTVATAAYFEVTGAYGFGALGGWDPTIATPYSKAAIILSMGAPATIWVSLNEIGLIPQRFDTQLVLMGGTVAAAGFGYVLLFPILEPLLQFSGQTLAVLTAPIAAVSAFVQWITSGCAKGWNPFKSPVDCRCADANNKPDMSEALVGVAFGTTEQQYDLRLDCMHKATTTGSWGTDPYDIGACDPSSGWMSTPAACVSAGEWAYQKWPTEIDSICKPMWNEVSHCVDATNPSMLPAQDVDKICATQFGEYARAGGVMRPSATVMWGQVGHCYDFRLPITEQQLN
jgi:hypothetical protein